MSLSAFATLLRCGLFCDSAALLIALLSASCARRLVGGIIEKAALLTGFLIDPVPCKRKSDAVAILRPPATTARQYHRPDHRAAQATTSPPSNR